MLPTQTVQKSRYAPQRAVSGSSRLFSMLLALASISLATPPLLGQQGTLDTVLATQTLARHTPVSESSTIEASQSEVSMVPLLWTAEEVVLRAIQADPLRKVLLHERRLAQMQRSGHHANCAVDNWIAYHLDQRITRREQEVRAQALKLHFGLVGLQAQTLVLDELQQLLEQYSEMVEKIAAAQEATDLLVQQSDELTIEISHNQAVFAHSLAQLRVQLQSLLQCEEALHYWPSEPLIIQFEEVDIEQQVVVAKTQRSDVAVWQSTPRVAGNPDELAKVEKLLSASWLLVPLSQPGGGVLKLLAHTRNSDDLKRRWSVRQQQIQELARAKTLELENEVRLKALALNQAYRSAQQSQLSQTQASQRLDTLHKRQEMGVAQPERFWEAAFGLQRIRSETFKRLSEARQAEIELDYATASQREWSLDTRDDSESAER